MLMPSCRLLLAATLGLALLAGFRFPRQPVPSAKPSPTAEAAADPPLIDLAGYNDVIAKYRGKGLMVTFWATWCEPCRDEFPMIVTLAKEYAPHGLAVVGVTLDEDPDINLVRHFLALSRPDFPNYRQRPGIDANAFYQGVNPQWRGVMPQTDFYARDGHLARYFVGQRQRDAFVDAIRLILAMPVAESRPGHPSIAGN